MTIDRSIRQSQIISPFGVGGIYDIGAESFVAMDTTKWQTRADPDIRLPRLENILRVDGFRSAPIASDASFPGAIRSGQSIPYYRFPTWLFCPKCRGMVKWQHRKMEEKGQPPRCKKCAKKVNLVPMRFMAVCKSGHLMDVPWGRWAHFGPMRTESQRRCNNHNLEFISEPSRGAGLQSLVVRCRTCAARNDLERLPYKDSLKPIFKCTGTHPWQSLDQAPACDQIPQVVQRGASNAYYPMVVSAIDIRAGHSSESDLIETIMAHAKWPFVSEIFSSFDDLDNDAVQSLVNNSIDEMISDQTLRDLGVASDTIWALLKRLQSAGDSINVESENDNVLVGEWKSFINPPVSESNANFIAEVVDLESFGNNLIAQERPAWQEFRKLICQVTLTRKLRVVRALKGFNRLEPEPEMLTPPTLGVRPGWLPATEIFGEGIFISLDPEKLNEWEARLPAEHLKTLKKNKEISTLGFLPEVSPRFVLLHTLSHLLMRQLCFECGYSSSSLTERIYCDPTENMAGLLIYTASADSEGALGGLVREGLPDRLYGTFKTALFRGTWCSNDPICSEMLQQGIQGLNKAACHACTLVAETSCDHANSLLDRGVVLGSLDNPSIGYFTKFVKMIEEALE